MKRKTGLILILLIITVALLVCTFSACGLFSKLSDRMSESLKTEEAAEPSEQQPAEQTQEEQPEEQEEQPETPVHTHAFGDWVTQSEATCTTTGIKKRTCSCGEEESEVIDALGHDYQREVIAPTCTEGGHTVFTCSRCRDTYVGEQTDPLGHDDSQKVVTPATCTEGGYTTYTCSRCEVTFVVDETQALGHDYHATVTPATCTNGGYTIYVCSNCQRSYVGDYTTALGHSDDEVTVVPPTCTERGYTSYHCSRCNKTRQANYTDPIGHDYAFEGFVWTDYTARAQYICTHDETHVVSYKAKVTNAVTTQASCDHVGIRTYTATYDGHSGTKEQTIPMLDHTYGDVVAEIPATCEHEGRKAYRECTVCHTFFTKEGADWVPTEEADLVIPETHVYLFYEKQEETCSQDGRKAYYECSVCHELFSDESGEKIRVAEADLVIPASHDFVLTEVIEPTCTAQGYTVYTCTRCQDLYVDDYLPALGHDYVFAYFIWDGFDAQAKYVCTHDADHVLLYDAEVTSEITLAPTCTSTGIRTYTATYQEEGDVRTQTIEALPHTFDEIIAEVSPDCLHSGVAAHVTCSVCHTLLKQQGEALVPATEEELVLPALGHDYQADVTPPTCTQGGYTTYTCSRCSDSYEDDATAALGHDYQAVVTPATCTEDGFTTYTCSRCSDSYVGDETAALGHDYQAVVTPATCTTDGYTTYTCSRCNDVYVADHVDALGHDYAFDRFVWEGYTAQARYVCAHDAEHVLLYDAEVTSEITLAPTCTSTGIRTYTAVYQEEQDARTQVLDLLPHTLDEIVAEVSPDCLHSGTAEHVTCSVCHTLLKKQGEDWIPATEEDLVIPALGHDYQADVTPPTCTQGGYTTYTCSRCSDSYADDETAALGHDYQAVVTSATCTTDGYTTYTCSRCNDVYVADHVEALGHDFAFDRFVWDGYDAQAKYVCAHDAEHVLLFDAEVTSEVTLEPTCTTTGTRVYTATYETNVDQKIQTLDALGHDYGALIEEISPTCTETGVYAHYECANCHVLFLGQGENKLPVSAAVLVMPALGHDHQKSGVTEPTCTEQGYTTYSCTRCSDSYEADFVAPLGHDYQSTGVTAPTCTAQGYTTYQCSRCGDSYHDDHTDALGHSYLATEMVEAGCETSGYTIYECSRCHNTYHDDFTDPLGHKNKVKVTAPTCTEGGYTTYTCSRCKKVTIGDQTEPLGHDPVAGEVVPPTCSSEGYTVFTCSRCGLVYQGAFLPATEHDYVAGEVVPPTCSSMGYTVFTCSQCGDTYQGEFLPMIEHDYAFDSFVWEGYTAQAKLVCSSNAEHVTFVDATITSEVTVTPTCTATGIRVYTATYQTHSDTKEQSIAQTDHSYTELVAAVPATCVEEGVIAYCTCSVCGGYFDADHNAISEQDLTAPVDPDNHDWNDQGRCARCGEYFGTEGLVYTLNGNAYAITGYTGTDTEIYLPSRHEGKNVTTIAAYAFSERSDITFLRIPSGVTSIQDSAFSGCTRLVEVCNLSTLTIESNSSANGGVGLYARGVYTSDDYTRKYSVDENGYMLYVDGTTKVLLGYHGSDALRMPPSDVTEIAPYAFADDTTMTGFVIPTSLSAIGKGAFSGCTSLADLFLRSGAYSCGEDNDPFNDATLYIYSETQPQINGNYWHYVAGQVAIWTVAEAPVAPNAPNLQLNATELYIGWENVENATHYLVSVDHGSWNEVHELKVFLSATVNSHIVEVKSMNGDVEGGTAEYSYLTRNNVLSTISTDLTTASWTATAYSLTFTVNGNFASYTLSGGTYSYTCPAVAGTYQIAVTANEGYDSVNDIYYVTEINRNQTIVIATLSAPSPQTSAGGVSWAAVTNATRYEYSTDDGSSWNDLDSTRQINYTAFETSAGAHNVLIRAVGNGTTYLTSANATFTYETKQMYVPQMTRASESLEIYWGGGSSSGDAVINNDATTFSVTKNELTLSGETYSNPIGGVYYYTLPEEVGTYVVTFTTSAGWNSANKFYYYTASTIERKMTVTVSTLSAPTINAPASAATTVGWDAVTDATRYEYSTNGGSSWTSTTSTSVDLSSATGQSKIRVRALSSDPTKLTSNASSDFVYYSTPVTLSTPVFNGTRATWVASARATQVREGTSGSFTDTSLNYYDLTDLGTGSKTVAVKAMGGFDSSTGIYYYGTAITESVTKSVTKADVSLDFEDGPKPATGASYYTSAGWSQQIFSKDSYSYTSTSQNMRSRYADDGTSLVVNMYSDSTARRFLYSGTGSSLGVANAFSVDIGHYYSNCDLWYKIMLIDTNDRIHMIAGTTNSYVVLKKEGENTTGNRIFRTFSTIGFGPIEVKSICFELKGPQEVFLYIDNLKLSYVDISAGSVAQYNGDGSTNKGTTLSVSASETVSKNLTEGYANSVTFKLTNSSSSATTYADLVVYDGDYAVASGRYVLYAGQYNTYTLIFNKCKVSKITLTASSNAGVKLNNMTFAENSDYEISDHSTYRVPVTSGETSIQLMGANEVKNSGDIVVVNTAIKQLEKYKDDVTPLFSKISNVKAIISAKYTVTKSWSSVKTDDDKAGTLTIQYLVNGSNTLVTSSIKVKLKEKAAIEGDDGTKNNSASELLKQISIDPHEVVFGGSSSMEKWKSVATDMIGFNVADVGIGGTYSTDWSANGGLAERLIYPYNPRAVVIFVGVNNLKDGKTDVAGTLSSVQGLLEQIHTNLPHATVSYVLINRVPLSYSGSNYLTNENVDSFNSGMQTYKNSHSWLHLISLNTGRMAYSGGNYGDYTSFTDTMHLNKAGYTEWAYVVRKQCLELN